MITTEIVKEIETLQEKLTNLTENLAKTSQMKVQKENEYNSKKTQHEQRMLKLGKHDDSLVYKMNKLETAIDDLKLRIAEMKRDMGNFKGETNDMVFELPKIKAESANMRATNQKKIESLKEELETTKEDLKKEKQSSLEIEKSYEILRQKMAKELEMKRQSLKGPLIERFNKTKERYKSRKEPMLNQINSLEFGVNDLTNQILSKTEDLKRLQHKGKALQKEFQKLSISRLISESQITMTAMHKALTYLQEHPKSLTDDVILGALITRANLKWIFTRPESHVDLDYSLSEKLTSLIAICDNIIDSKKFNKTHILSILGEKLLENGAEDLKYGILSQQDEDFVLPNFDSCQSLDEYFMRGTPEDSDFCINELFRTNCEVSESCWQSEVNRHPHSGYKTSHRLIYLQAATKLQCEKINPRKFSAIREWKKMLCQKMLLEAKALTKKPYFPLTRDLFMEHIALCGFEGYVEFASKNWRYQVRSWQGENDCFEIDENFNCSLNTILKNGSFIRTKRTDTVIDRCHTHVTAVAVSALAFFLRFLINVAFLTS